MSIFTPEMVVAITALITVLANTYFAWDARRKLVEIKHQTNGMTEKLVVVSKALGHAEGEAEQKDKTG